MRVQTPIGQQRSALYVCRDIILSLSDRTESVSFRTMIYLFIYYESRTKVHVKNKNYAYDTHK